MNYSELLHPSDVEGLQGWLVEASGELLVLVDFFHSGGSGDGYLIRSVSDLVVLLGSIEWPELSLSVLAGKPFPHRGVVDDDFIVRIYLQAPREDGLSSQAEFETLKSLEDALESLQSEAEATYVGRCTSDGCRDLYFYSRTGIRWEERVARIMKEFPTYEFECGTRSDPSWTTYFNFLNPSDEDRERIENRRTCEVLAKKGDKLATERPIDHWAYFPNPSLRRAFVLSWQRCTYRSRTRSSDTRMASS